jgi:hypothetical protein
MPEAQDNINKDGRPPTEQNNNKEGTATKLVRDRMERSEN